MKPFRALWRGLRATAHVLGALWTIRTELGRLTPSQTELVVREWTRRMLLILGVELVVEGTPPNTVRCCRSQAACRGWTSW